MNDYRKTLTVRIYLLLVPALFSVVLNLYNIFFASDAAKENYLFGFLWGIAIALGFLSLILIMRYRKILGDETKLVLYYNKEHDERLKAIRAKAGMPMLLFTSIGMIGAGIIAGYFSQTASIVLIAAAGCQMLIGSIAKLIYMKQT